MRNIELFSKKNVAKTTAIVIGAGVLAPMLSSCGCDMEGKGAQRGCHAFGIDEPGKSKKSPTPKSQPKAPATITGSLLESLLHNGGYAPVMAQGKNGATSEVGACGAIRFTRSGAFKDRGNPGWNAFYHGNNEGHNITLDGLKNKLPCARTAAMPLSGEAPQLLATVWREGKFMPDTIDAIPATEQVGALALGAAALPEAA